MESPPARQPPSRVNVLLRILIFLVFGYLTLRLLAGFLYPLFGLLIASVLGAFAGAAAANSLSLRIWEQGKLADIGLHWTRASRRHLLIGVLGGMGAGALVLVPALATGLATMRPAPDAPFSIGSFVFVTLVLLFGAVGEEMFFRGYGFQVLVPVAGEVATILPMAVIFSAAHLANQASSPLGLFNTFAWGALLGWALLKSGDLWFPIGLHFGWNWCLPLFGVNVSGFTMKLTGYTFDWQIGEIWSGGAYGPEGGLLCTAAVAVLAAFLRRAPVTRQALRVVDRQEERA